MLSIPVNDLASMRCGRVVLLLAIGLILDVQSGVPADLGEFPSAKSSSARIVTEHDHGKVIELKTDEVMVLRLEAVPGTGYGWQIVRITLPGFELLESPIFEDSDQGLIGGSAMEVFRFHAAVAGSGELELIYKRPWEGDVSPEKVFQLNIIIQEGP